MPMPPYPTIVVPGITATYLQDTYPLPPEVVWSVLDKDYERAALHPDNLRFEAREPARLVAGQLFEVAYGELIAELRYNLAARPDLPVPVYPFGYDWRHPLALTEQQLADFVDEVIERTKLMRHYAQNGYADDPRVNLIGHSMGGLVIAGYLERAGKQHKVSKVATLASPFQGSFEAVIKVTTGTADLGESAPSSREREAARLTPALYQLIPSFGDGLRIDPGLPQTSLLDERLWQPSIVDTIRQYVRQHSVQRMTAAEQAAQAQRLFKGMLDGAKQHRARLGGLKLADIGLDAGDWLCVVGVDSETRVEMEIERRGRLPNFKLRSADRKNQWRTQDPAARWLTGDGTVPFAGAVPPFLALENLVCVTPDDYGYWELKDKAVSSLAGFHGILPNMNLLHRLVVAHFTGRPDRHGNIWGRMAPGVTKQTWAPPVRNLKPEVDDPE